MRKATFQNINSRSFEKLSKLCRVSIAYKRSVLLVLCCVIRLLSYAQPIPVYNSSAHAKIAADEQRNWQARIEDNVELAPTNDYDITYHRLRWNVDPRIKHIEGSVTTVFKVLGPGFQTIHFDLSDSLHVDSIFYHQNKLSAVQPQANILTIPLTSAIAANSFDSISVFYSGIPTRTGFGSFNVGTHGDTINGFDSTMWTLSEPYGSRDWWPGKMTLTDKIDSLDIYVTVPVPYSVATNGLPVDTVINGNSVTHHWKHRYPIANYLVCFASSNYTFLLDTVHTPSGVLQVWNFWYPEYMPIWLQYKPDDHAMIQLYHGLFGPYPFIKEKYGHAQMLRGGGMEHQTMTFVSDGGFELIAHELAHHWFGDKLTCHSWQDIWLNEGFATYSSALCYQYMDFGGTDYYSIFKKQLFDHVISEPAGSVIVDDTTSVSRIFSARLSYDKGAYLLHMLRWKLGDEDFFNAIRDYLADPGLAYSFCKTDDLKEHFESESGQDLTTFFNQWFYGQGFPTYILNWSEDEDGNVSLLLNQTTSHPSVSFFEMPVMIKFKNATQDTTFILDNTINNQFFQTTLNFQADSVLIDPDLWILHGASRIKRMPDVDAGGFLVLMSNPVKDVLNVWYDNEAMKIESLQIYNPLGQLVQQYSVSTDADNVLALNIPELASGAYMLKAQTDKGFIVRKFIKQ